MPAPLSAPPSTPPSTLPSTPPSTRWASPRVAHASFVLCLGLSAIACASHPPSPAPTPAAASANEAATTIPTSSSSVSSSPEAFMAEVERRAQILRETHEPADREWLERLLPSEPPPPPVPPSWKIELVTKGGMLGADERTIVRADGSWTRTAGLSGQRRETKQGRLDPQLMPRLAAFVARQTVPPRRQAPASRGGGSVSMVTDVPDRVVEIHEGSGVRTLRTQHVKDEQWEPLHTITAAIDELLVSKRAAATP